MMRRRTGRAPPHDGTARPGGAAGWSLRLPSWQRTLRRLRCDDRGLSVVVGAVLLFALIILILVMMQVNFVPVWEEDAEAAMAQHSRSQFTAIKSEADKQVGEATTTAVSMPLDLQDARAGRVFRPVTLPGTLEFVAGGTGSSLSSSQLLLQQEGGTSLAGLSETWATIATGATITDIADIDHLRIRLTDPNPGCANSGPTGHYINLVVTDGDGNVAGDLRVYTERSSGNGYTIKTRVRDGASPPNVLYDQGEFLACQDSPPFYWVDTREPSTLFHQILAAAKKPLTMTFERVVLQGDYAITYTEHGTGTLVGNAGLLVPDYTVNLSGGRLAYNGKTLFFPDQRLVLEHGAVILEQDGAAAMLIPPTFEAGLVGQQTRIHLTLPSLVGTTDSRTGGGTAAVLVRGQAPLHVAAQAPDFTMHYSTAYPQVWASFWSSTLEDGGLSEAAGHYTIATSPSSATLTVWGTSQDPTSTLNDIALVIHQASVQISLRT